MSDELSEEGRSSAEGSASAATASAKRSPVVPAPVAWARLVAKSSPVPRCAVRGRGRRPRRRTDLGDAGRLLQFGHGLLDVGQRDRADGHRGPPSPGLPPGGQVVELDRLAPIELGAPEGHVALVQSLEHCRALPGTPPCLRGLACHLFCGFHLIGAPARPFGHPVGLGVGPLHGANREPAGGSSQNFEGSASTRRARSVHSADPGRPRPAVGPQPVPATGGPGAPSRGGSGRPSRDATLARHQAQQRLGRGRQRADLTDRLTKEGVDGRP